MSPCCIGTWDGHTLTYTCDPSFMHKINTYTWSLIIQMSLSDVSLSLSFVDLPKIPIITLADTKIMKALTSNHYA